MSKTVNSSFKTSIALLLAATCSIIAPASVAEESASSIARGARLYDKWWAVNGAEKPEGANPAYPADAKYSGKGAADFRCKECHGWDYMGKDGTYGSGSHATGIPGIRAAEGMDPAAVTKILQDANHGYSEDMLGPQDLQDLGMFVSQGQFDMDQYIDRSTKMVTGDAGAGEPVYNNVCAKCHGLDGARDEDGDLIGGDREALGLVANENPWEALHKIQFGQPDENMPALIALDRQISLDILAHMQTLPEEAVQ